MKLKDLPMRTFYLFVFMINIILTLGLITQTSFAAQSQPQFSKKQIQSIHLLNQKALKLIDLNNHHKISKPKLNISQINQYFQHSKFKLIFPAAQYYAQKGSQLMQLETGFMYEFGRGINKEEEKAALWYYLATQGYITSQNLAPFKRGINYFFGLNNHTQNFREAARWFRMAAELNIDRY